MFMAADRFIRLHFLGFSTMLAVLGAATVVDQPAVWQLVGVVVGAICFHNFAYVFNDVVDLPVDRTDPARQGDFLVSGAIRPGVALAFSLIQIPVAVVVTLALGGGWKAVAVLLAGFAFMAIYDLWGKKGPVPPLTDLSQGLGWGSLAPWAALALGFEPTVLTWVVAAYGAGFILLINGVHGGLRDLANDLARGARTTASFFGSQPTPRGATMTPRLAGFAMTVQLGLIAVSLAPLLRNDFSYTAGTWAAATAAVVLVDLICLVYMALTLRPEAPGWQRDFRLHLLLLNLVLVVLFVPYLQPMMQGVFLALFCWPLIFFDLTIGWVGRLWRRLMVGPVRTTVE